jgi:hypothetical protein
MTIEVFESLVDHETVVFQRMRNTGARSARPGDQILQFFAALAAQANNDLVGLLRRRHGFIDQRSEEGLGHQHGVDAVVDNDHVGRVVAAVLRLDSEAEAGKECPRPVKIADRKVEDDLLVHDASSPTNDGIIHPRHATWRTFVDTPLEGSRTARPCIAPISEILVDFNFSRKVIS